MVKKQNIIECECLTAGGGSAGFAAALAAAEGGVSTVLVERNSGLGGTSCFAGVNCYEPVAGAGGIPERFCRLLLSDPSQCGIYRINRHFCLADKNDPPFPGCESVIDENAVYEDTLAAHNEPVYADTCRLRRGIIFEPEYLDRTMQRLLEEAHCRVLTGKNIVDVGTDGRKITYVLLDDGTEIHAAHWIDCCGILARKSGCTIFSGRDPKSRFNEPDAPEFPDDSVNGVSRIFRISPAEQTARITPAKPCSWAEQYPPMVAVQYPNGDYNCNMLPTMSGAEFFKLGEKSALIETERRVREYWQYLQREFPEFRRYEIKYLFPAAGVRESFRVECRYMLNENDIIAGMNHIPEDAIARCDHIMDLHGAASPNRSTGCYPVPFRCLQPAAVDNLLVAGRIAGFSSLAASSCRLSRTMMYLGQAAGRAAVLAVKKGCLLSEINGKELNNEF